MPLQALGTCYESIAVFDQRWYSQLNAVLNIIRTLFVTFALGFAMITFNKDAQRLVLRPIERMLRKVKEVSENPLAGRATSKIKAGFENTIILSSKLHLAPFNMRDLLEFGLMTSCMSMAMYWKG